MVNRNYLPYQSAREYIDRGMAKWMGFFLSEHSNALSNTEDIIDCSQQMAEEDILLALSQAYINKLRIQLFTSLRNRPFIGKIYDIIDNRIWFSVEDTVISFQFSEIIRLCLLEE